MPAMTARSRNDVPYRPQFQWVCSGGHLIQSDAALCGPCPACIDGEPCDGELVRVGPGSRGPR